MPNTSPKSPQRHKKAAGKTEGRSTISAAVSIPPDLYHVALKVASKRDEGNFSRYVRNLIRKDVGMTA